MYAERFVTSLCGGRYVDLIDYEVCDMVVSNFIAAQISFPAAVKF